MARRCGMFTVRCVECDCAQHSEQYTHYTYDMLTHYRIKYKDVIFFTEF